MAGCRVRKETGSKRPKHCVRAVCRRNLEMKWRTKRNFHAAIEEFAAEGYTHVEANCPRCRVIRLRPIDQLPKISLGLTLDQFAHGYAVRSVEARCYLSAVAPGGRARHATRMPGLALCLLTKTGLKFAG